MTRCKSILIAGILALAHTPAQAAEGVVGANLAAMGGAGAGVGSDNAAITMNPGLLGLYERYDMQGHFRYGGDNLKQWSASVLDGRTSKILSLGVYYVGDHENPPLRAVDLPGWTLPGVDPENIKRHHSLTLAFAVQGWDRRLSVGASGTFSLYNHDRGGTGSTGNADFGVGVRPTDWLDLGVAGRNLIPVNDLGELPLTVIGGFRVHGDAGALVGDTEWREANTGGPLSFAGGGEVPLGEIPVLRAGYRYDGPDAMHKATLGVGLVGPTGSFDIGTQVPVGKGQPTLSGLSFIVAISLQAPRADDPVGW